MKEYYLSIQRNEVLIHATIWTNLENMLSKINQSQNPTYLWFQSYEMSRIRDRKQVSVCLGLGFGGGECLLRAPGFCFVIFVCLFIWLCQISIVAHGTSVTFELPAAACGIEPWAPASGVWTPSHWTTRDVPGVLL